MKNIKQSLLKRWQHYEFKFQTYLSEVNSNDYIINNVITRNMLLVLNYWII